MQKLTKFLYSQCTVADLVLDIISQFGKSPVITFRHEYRVVAKSGITTFFFDYFAFYHSFKEILLSVQYQRNSGAELCFTVFLSVQFVKKFMLAEMAATASKDSLQGLLDNSREVGNQLSAQVKNLLRDTTKMGNSIRQYQSMLNVNMTEQEKLNALLSQKKNELNERERTINELQDMIKAQNDKVQNLLSNVKDALLGFSTDELTVREKDGKVYVAMSDKLLFQSGSARLDKRGEEALGKLAEVLNKQTDIDVFIEGHTDNKPINTVQFKDNWDLSVIRATSVVRILIKNYNVNPLQIQPSGRGEYMPIDDNETIEGRSKNRRTEIIMAPKLDKLFQMLQSSEESK